MSAALPNRADQYEELDDDAARRWRKFGPGQATYYPGLLGCVVEEVRVDYCRMRLPFKPELLQGGGMVHGGAVASLLDAVMVPAVGSVLPSDARYSTVDMHVQFIGANRDEDAVAEGWVVKRGRSVVFCESEAYSADSGRLLGRSVLTYNVAAPRN